MTFNEIPPKASLLYGREIPDTYNHWWRLFEGPIVNLFFVFTLLGLFWPLVRRYRDKK